jgi:ABC-type branched-subunit amino acid transport system ATPase component
MVERQAQSRFPRALRGLALQAAAITAPLIVLLFWRVEVAARLDLVGALVSETLLFGGVAVGVAWVTVHTRSTMPAGLLLFVGGIVAAVGLALMAWTIQLSLFVVGGVLYVLGAAPSLVLHRPLLAMAASPGNRLRTMSLYWVGVSVGAAWPLGLRILTDMGYDTVLWISFGGCLAAAVLIGPHALVHDDDVETDPAAGVLDAPWPRRSYGAAFGIGLVVFGGAQPAWHILVDEWQRSPRQVAAVLAVGALASAAINGFGPWYHRLGRLAGSRRADAIGLQLLVAGVLVFVGALSTTYIGLVVCWMIAGGALGLAAAALDSAVFPAVAPHLRRRLAFAQLMFVTVGAFLGLVSLELFPASVNDQWRLGFLALPLVGAGWAVRRYADSSQDSTAEVASVAAVQVPRRVAGLDGEPTPVLSVEGLQVAYGSVQVLFDVDLTIEPGQVVALLGTNGAGKTTLLRSISGLEPTIGGRIVYTGLDITKTRPTWRVGMGLHQVVGGSAIIGPLTVAENLRLFCHSLDRGDAVDPFAEVFDIFPRLAERQHQRAETMSGGERQMLAMSKALILRPRLLLIDEFSLGLAPRVIADLLPVVRRIADRGAAVLLVEQSVNIALSVADYAYVMEKGEIGYQGPSAVLRSQPDLVRSAYLEGLSHALRG